MFIGAVACPLAVTASRRNTTRFKQTLLGLACCVSSSRSWETAPVSAAREASKIATTTTSLSSLVYNTNDTLPLHPPPSIMVDAEQIKKAIPAQFYMISGSEDKQYSADVSNVGAFALPDPAGKAGGACTSTLLSVLGQLRGQSITWMDLLHQMRGVLRQKGFDQVPQLSTSRLIDVNDRFQIVPDRCKQANGSRRAILVGINYIGQQGQLSGCHNDVKNIKQYLIQQEGFPEKDMLVLMDDGHHHSPTRRNLEDAFKRITQYAKADDVVFIHYSGHGGRVRDTSGDEADGYDETLIPVDFKSAGQIIDDQVYTMLVKAMPADVNVTVLMDCCHSGTVMDLPYTVNATESKMHANDSFNFGNLTADPAAMACCACLTYMLMSSMMD